MRLEATYDFAVSFEDYREVLELILRSNQRDGRFEGMTIADIASPIDRCSRFITCRIAGRIAGCARITPVDGERWRSPYALVGHQVPECFWRSGFVEGHSLAIDPQYRGSGLLFPIVSRVVSAAYKFGYDYVLIGSVLDLVTVYESMGFVEIERREVTPLPGWTFLSVLLGMDLPMFITIPPPESGRSRLHKH